MLQSNDNRRKLIYLVLVLVAAGSFAVAYLTPVTGLFRDVLAVPAATALFGIVIQVLRDEQAYERQRESKEREQGFTLGIISHMAQVVFDKEVQFCEEYAEAVNTTVLDLLRNGPSQHALEQASNLSQLRDKFSLWVPKDLYQKLYAFESALREIGSAATVIPLAGGEAERIAFSQRMYNRFSNVLGFQTVSGEINPEVAAATVNEYLKEVLGAADYIALRDYALKEAKRRT